LGAGFRRLADPKISLASFAGLFLGACAAARDGPLAWGWLALTVAGIFAIEVAKNASGEIVDFESGTDLAIAPQDRSPFSGGKRVLVDGLLTRGQTAAIAASGYVLGIGIGLVIAFAREPRVLAFGIVGVACAFFYHASPVRLSYRGLGELAVAFSYGPLVVCGTYLVLRGELPARVFWLSLPLGMLIAAFLWINEFPDAVADAAAHKRTLVVRLGRRRASRLFGALVASALAVLALLPALGLPQGVWLGGLSIVPAMGAARTLRAHPETTSAIVPAQARTLAAFLVLAAGSGMGLFVGVVTPSRV
jgi:1,4-dihydroxy-2-naphthoate octaprenyltransferase